MGFFYVWLGLYYKYIEVSGRFLGDVVLFISNVVFLSWLRIFFLIFENIFIVYVFLNVKYNIIFNVNEEGFFGIKNMFYFEYYFNVINF